MSSSAERAPLPVTLVTGFLGAGKTTFVNHLLRTASARRVGVLVNDFGDVSIDADLVLARSEDVISLANGCICCSLRSDLSSQIMSLAENPERPEHLLVEASGVSEPRPMLEALLELERFQVVRLDGVVAVIDASEHLRHEGGARQLAKRQLLAADLVLVTKTDLVRPAELADLDAALDAQTPAKRLRADHGEVPAEIVLGFEGEPERRLERDPERVLELTAVTHDVAKWRTWRFSTSTPVVFKALVPVLRDLPEGIYRAKGFLDIVERPGDRLVLHLAGAGGCRSAPWGAGATSPRGPSWSSSGRRARSTPTHWPRASRPVWRASPSRARRRRRS